ncbi:hypothetical protein [Duganella callida]|uniref:Uncharacterized protein n=1 Tax=Duganella callida TaxID=2561932 RepID=A0A4Y9S9N4_9BURK|nr:hypothetical protein [Duganella callida]TFW17241.1 hypothetical protein E4L98_20950 [Duganella callida]
MASINDVFNELQAVNGNLGLIHADGIAQTNATNTVNGSVNTLDGDVKAGFTATVNALNMNAAIEIEAVKLLFHLTQQADTMICTLEHISKNTCGILTQATIQTHLQKAIAGELHTLVELTKLAHPAAALELEHFAKLRAEIEHCCPPPQMPPPACTYEPCKAPKPVDMPDLPNPYPHQPG